MGVMKFDKTPLTVAQQVELLEKRGLQMPDKERAKAILSSISYYRLSGYWYTFHRAVCSAKSDKDFISKMEANELVTIFVSSTKSVKARLNQIIIPKS